MENSCEIEMINADAYNNIAIAYFKQKKYEDAWENIQHAAEQSTTNSVVKENYEKFTACVKVKK